MAGSTRYVFSPRRGFVVTPGTARVLLEGGAGEAAVDFGLGRLPYRDRGECVELGGDERPVCIDKETLARLVEGDRVLFSPIGGSPYFVEARRGGHYYKLVYLGEGVRPTLEIDGVHMHNIVGTDPWRDALRKVRLAGVRRGHRVLDICTGLGYTALASLGRGASVTSIEVSRSVLWVAEHNPYSRGLSDVDIILGDAFEAVEEVVEGVDRVIHDPPVFSHAGLLYSSEFYSKIYRVLRRGGVLFHYTGAPGERRGVKFQRGVVERLRRAGFDVVRVIKGYGVVARRV